MARILVTGATGFIGQYVIDRLLAQGQEVVASSGQPEAARQMRWWDAVEYRPFSLEVFDDQADYYTYFGRPDTLIHLAWKGLPNYKADIQLEQAEGLHLPFLKNMLRHGLGHLSVTGTCLEYGMQEGCLTEETPALPFTNYGKGKDLLRRLLEQERQERPFHFQWIRLFYMYGKGQSPKSLFSQLDAALERGDKQFNMSGGEQIRDFLPVEKVAEYIVKVSGQTGVEGIFNCCSGQPVTVKQLVLDYLEEQDRQIQLNLGFYPYPDYEPMAFWGDNRKINSL